LILLVFRKERSNSDAGAPFFEAGPITLAGCPSRQDLQSIRT
jgi:hypothetical protein